MFRKVFKTYYPWMIVSLFILFIFSNSLQTGTDSGSLSGSITAWFMNVLSKINITPDFDTLHHIVRKGAHFSEYALLAFFTTCAIRHKPLCKPLINFLIIMLSVPCIDEAIQLFVPGRAGMIGDCLIDMSGFLTGGIFTYCLFRLYDHFRKES